MNDVIPDDNAKRRPGSADRVDTAEIGEHAQSDMVDIIGLDHGPHGSLIPCAGDDSCVRLMVDTIVGNNIIIANADMNAKGTVKNLAGIVNLVVGDNIFPRL